MQLCAKTFKNISITLQEFVIMTEILTPISADNSPVLFSLSKEKRIFIVKGFLKFNSSLTKDQNYIIEIKKLIRNFWIKNEFLFHCQLKWKLLKYEV